MDARQQRLAGDAEQLTQLAPDALRHRQRRPARRAVLLQRTADERAQQHVALGRAAGILDAAVRAGNDRTRFDARHDEAEALERLWNLRVPIRQAHRCRGRVRDGAQLVRQPFGSRSDTKRAALMRPGSPDHRIGLDACRRP